MLTKETGLAHPVSHYEIVGLGSIMGIGPIGPFNWSNASERSISTLYLCVNTWWLTLHLSHPYQCLHVQPHSTTIATSPPTKAVFGSCQSIFGKYSIFWKCYFSERKMFSCVWLPQNSFYGKLIPVFGSFKHFYRKCFTCPIFHTLP